MGLVMPPRFASEEKRTLPFPEPGVSDCMETGRGWRRMLPPLASKAPRGALGESGACSAILSAATCTAASGCSSFEIPEHGPLCLSGGSSSTRAETDSQGLALREQSFVSSLVLIV